MCGAPFQISWFVLDDAEGSRLQTLEDPVKSISSLKENHFETMPDVEARPG